MKRVLFSKGLCRRRNHCQSRISEWSKILVFSFTTFSGHRPVQREWAWTGLIGPMQGAIRTQSYNPSREVGPHHRGLRPLLFPNIGVGSYTSHMNRSVKVLSDGTCGFSSLSEKARKSNHLQMSLQRQHFLLSYLKTLSVGPARV